MSAGARHLGLLDVVVRPIQAFLRTEAASGILLLSCAAAAIVWANVSPASYEAARALPLALRLGPVDVAFSLHALIDDGLMAVFFFVVGLEIKRELVVGELNSVGRAALPAVAALGGMVLPALIFALVNRDGPGRHGWGVPMATDIAFCVGILTLLRTRVPHALVVFVTALAIFDDLGGILVIALFYGRGTSAEWLAAAAALTGLLALLNLGGVRSGWAFALGGVVLWYALHHAGIHPTIAGVVAGLAVPARPACSPRDVLPELAGRIEALRSRRPDEELDAAEVLTLGEGLEHLQSPLQQLVHALHPAVAFAIMPLFALANAGVPLAGASLSTWTAPATSGVALGLVLGKPLGIFGFTLLAVRSGLAPLPGRASAFGLFGVSVLAGIGFTVALFIANLAFVEDPALANEAKLGVLGGSLAAGVVGYALLRLGPTKNVPAAFTDQGEAASLAQGSEKRGSVTNVGSSRL